MAQFRRIGILTSGGDAPGMNMVIRSVARTALSHGVEVFGILEGYKGLINNNMKLFTKPTDVSNIGARGGTVLYTDRCLEFLQEEYRLKAVEICRQNHIDGIIACGGDGTFRGATKLSALGIPTIGITGTIDNDIASTDYTVGFDTACNTVVEAIDRLRDTCVSHNRCSVVEVMGRHCGDIALRAGIAGGASAVAIPEIPFDEDACIETIKRQKAEGKRGYIVVVSEGLKGYGQKLTEKIEKETGIESRYCCLAHTQRGGNPTMLDRLMASEMGVYAVEKLFEGKSDIVIAQLNNQIVDIDIKKALMVDELYKGKLSDEEIAKIPPEDLKWANDRIKVLKDNVQRLYKVANMIK